MFLKQLEAWAWWQSKAMRAIWACKTETLPNPHIKQTSKYLWVNFLSNQALCTVQWNNAQIPDCVWPLAACFVKQWEAWPWWQPQDNSRPPWPLVSTRESHFMLFKTASETRVSFRVQSRFEFQVWHLNLISTLWKWSNMDFNVLGSHQTIIANCLFSNQFFWF